MGQSKRTRRERGKMRSTVDVRPLICFSSAGILVIVQAANNKTPMERYFSL